jgi:hypothetical protein
MSGRAWRNPHISSTTRTGMRTSTMASRDTSATTVPRYGKEMARPSCSSWRKASRIGPRLICICWERSSSISLSPGLNSPAIIASRSVSATWWRNDRAWRGQGRESFCLHVSLPIIGHRRMPENVMRKEPRGAWEHRHCHWMSPLVLTCTAVTHSRPLVSHRSHPPCHRGFGLGEEPVGATYSVTSCDLRILMDQPTQPISSLESPSRHDDNWLAGSEWRRLPKARCGRCTL